MTYNLRNAPRALPARVRLQERAGVIRKSDDGKSVIVIVPSASREIFGRRDEQSEWVACARDQHPAGRT